MAQFGVIFLLFALGLEFSTTKVHVILLVMIFLNESNLFLMDNSRFIIPCFSFVLFELLLFWEVYFKLSYLCSYVELH